MGRWTKLKGKLEKFVNPPDFQEKINTAKLEILGVSDATGGNSALIAKGFVELKRQKKELKDKLSELNIKLEAYSQLFVDCVEDDEVQKLVLSDGATVYLKDDVLASVEDRKKFYQWIKKTKQVQLLTVNWATANAMVKQKLETGKPIPPGIKVYFKTCAAARGIGAGEEE